MIAMLEVRETKKGLAIAVKVVPNARKDEIVGLIGDRLKLRVCAPPEGGKANKSVCKLIAKALGIKKTAVSVAAGESSPLKTIEILGIHALEFENLTLRINK